MRRKNKMSDTMKEYIAEAEKDLLHTYNRYQIVLDKGEGVHLYDTDGKKYLDFVAGICPGLSEQGIQRCAESADRQGDPHLQLLLQRACHRGGS
jgi:acetylornithine/succinyldiaminopimelate/putrescine aminotransferase